MDRLFLMFLDHTRRRTTVGRTPLDEWSARRRDLYLTTHDTHNRQISMPPVGFEPTISVGKRPQTYALDRAVTGTGVLDWVVTLKFLSRWWAGTGGPFAATHVLPSYSSWPFCLREPTVLMAASRRCQVTVKVANLHRQLVILNEHKVRPVTSP